MQQTDTDRCIGEPVDDDHTPSVAVGVIGIEGNRSICRDDGDPYFVQSERLRRQMLKGIDIDSIFWSGDMYAHNARTYFCEIGPAGDHDIFVHPDDMGFELISDTCSLGLSAEEVAAADVDFVGEDERH